MKCKILAAALALLMLLSACGRKNSSYKYNIPNYSGDAKYSAEEQSEQSEQEQQAEGELVCVVKKSFYVNDDETYEADYPLYFWKYYYNEDGSLVREEEYSYQFEKYQAVQNYTDYEYDENGRCVREYSEHNEDGSTYEVCYEYDAVGNQTGKVIYKNGENVFECRSEYDDRGSVIAYYEPDRYGDGLDHTTEYEYNDDGTVRSETSYDAKGNLYYHGEHTYDANGLKVRSDVTSWGEYRGYWEYIYDDRGVLLEVHRYNEYGNENDEDRELYYTEYDEAGNQITYAVLYTTGTNRGTPRVTCRRTFDSAGNVTEERQYDYDGKLDNLYTYEYAPAEKALWQG